MSSAKPTLGLEQDLAAFQSETSAEPLDLVEVHLIDGTITGRVLTAGQRRRLDTIARDHGVAVDVQLVADPASGLEQGWSEIADGLIEVWRDPASVGEDHARQTQYLSTDGPLRVLGTQGGLALVEGPDWSMGWTPSDGLAPSDAGAGRLSWAARLRTEPGAAVLPDPARLAVPGSQVRAPGLRSGSAGGAELVIALLAEARSHLGVAYLWGGTTAVGFDCSGLVQRVFSSAVGVLLPKHSGDQRRQGLRVVAEDVRAGDLLFATPRDRRVGHVLLMTSATTVLHACRSELRVIEEGLEENATRYQHQGFRRPVLLQP